MDISVIVPIYGVEKYIDKSLRSLFSQTKTEGVEFILVNDCTKDRSIEIAREVIKDFPHCTIRLIEHEVNSGVAAARQTGLDAAIGEYTIHFDPDDWCEPEMLEELYAKAKEDDADLVVCDYYDNYTSGEYYRAQNPPYNNFEFIKKSYSNARGLVLFNKLIKRGFLMLNKINFIEGIDLGEDALVCVKSLSYTESFVYLPKAYYHYFHRNGSMTQVRNEASIEKSLKYIKELERFIISHNITNELGDFLTENKMIVKLGALQHSGRAKQKEYSKLYPEITTLITHANYPRLIWRLALYCASTGHLYMYNFISFSIKALRKLRNYISK